MDESRKYFAKIKSYFLNNRAKAAVLFLAIILWIIGLVTNPHAVENTGVIGEVLIILCFIASSYFIVDSNLFQKNPMTVLVSCCILYLLIIMYKMLLNPGYAIENDTIILTTLIYGELPYAFNGRKTIATATAAAITGLLFALLAYQKLWWLAINFYYIAMAAQFAACALRMFGGSRELRIAEIALFNIIPYLAALKLLNYPGIGIAFAPLNLIETVSALLILAFAVCSFICISKCDRRRHLAITGIISIVVQAGLCLLTKGNPALSDTFGLPFVNSNNLNMAFTGLAVGFVIAPSSHKLMNAEHK